MTWTCVECSTVYSVGAPRCPHCGSTEYRETHLMPKITVHGGASHAGQDVPPLIVAAPTEPSPAVEPAVRVQTLDDPYESWTRKDLVAEAKARDLPSYGAKDELVARLKANEPDEEG